MLGIGVSLVSKESIFVLQNNIVLLILAFIGIRPYLKNKIADLKKGKLKNVIEGGEVMYFMVVFLLVIAGIISSSFNPFIYFRF